MFLRSLLDRNPRFVEAAIELHQAGEIPANSCVLDLDAIESNTAGLCWQARELGLTVYAMTKQLGRAPGALAAMAGGGVDGFVAVDMACARPIARQGHNLGHLGHLVQVPSAETSEAAGLEPDFWTVFSENKAATAAAALATPIKPLVRRARLAMTRAFNRLTSVRIQSSSGARSRIEFSTASNRSRLPSSLASQVSYSWRVDSLTSPECRRTNQSVASSSGVLFVTNCIGRFAYGLYKTALRQQLRQLRPGSA